MYTVLARKWRPQVFEDLVGQQTVTQTLQNAIKEARIHHAFLFSGPRGVGKTTCARILAKALNCNSASSPVVTPCNVCPSCVDIANSRSMDVLEIDGASNRGIDEVRELRDSAKYQPIRDRFRVFIIDEVHMLTPEAFNALLKILEEPPPHVFFVFATTEYRKVPQTIVSRCQAFDFRRIPDRVLVQRLAHIVAEEKVEISERSLELIATASEGGLRDALGLLDQVIAFGGSKVDEKEVQAVLGLVEFEAMIELGQAIAKSDATAVLSILDRFSEYGIDYRGFYQELLNFYRELFLIRFGVSEKSSDERVRQLAESYDEIHLLRICHQLVAMQNSLRLSGNLKFLFEVTLVKLSRIQKLVPLDEIAESLKKNGSIAVAARPAATLPPPVPQTSFKPVPKPVSVPSTVGSTIAPPVQSERTNVAIADDFFAVFISDLELQNARLAAALENAKFYRNDSKVSFFVPDTFFGMFKVDPKDYADLSALLEKKLGCAVEVEIIKGEPPQEKEAVRVATPETLVENDPVVKEFVKTFKGKISKIELNKERYS